jgi:hypothetical protein
MPKANPPLPRPTRQSRAYDEINAWLQTPDAHEFLSAQTRRDDKTGCLIWTGKTQKRFPYGYFYRKTKIVYAHRAAYAAVHGPIPKGKVICHACDNPTCIAIEHLSLGTQQDNLADMRRKGRARWRSLLTRAHVVEIKKRLAAGETAAAIARDTGVSRGVIHAVKSGRTWGHVQGGDLSKVLATSNASSRIVLRAGDGTLYVMVNPFEGMWPRGTTIVRRFERLEPDDPANDLQVVESR